MSEQLLEQFNGQQYINVETFRRNGAGVKTPVWFVREEDALYVRTVKNSGKIKSLEFRLAGKIIKQRGAFLTVGYRQ